ncbi:hypothetical protein RDI58_007809 [Solanum bulbocastanum]|uniref:Uncharacterized protein n=1 Tax=Solanum bulbocastanum TaxID=147425 RepID=A0AAN8TZG4_SOLBU
MQLNTDSINVLPIFSWKQYLNINIINNEDVKLKFAYFFLSL